MSKNTKASSKRGESLKLGYRIKFSEERTGGPEDRVLIALDPNTQRDFERTIFDLVEKEETRLRGKR